MEKNSTVSIAHSLDPIALTPNDFVVYTYPFDTMPVLRGHVISRCVILKAGFAFSLLPMIEHSDITRNFPILKKWSAFMKHG